MKIEAGKEYRTRNGQKTTPMRAVNSENAYCRVAEVDGLIDYWTANGFYLRSCSEHPLDIVALWEEESQEAPTPVFSSAQIQNAQ